MPTPILATKLYIPPPRPGIVRRDRLVAQLTAGLHRKLTLIAAPAGFGKTTLVSEWVASGAPPTAWLALDAGESDLARFLRYLVAALQTVVPELEASVGPALKAPQPPPADVVLAAVLNAIAARPGKLVLVLDDYHLVDALPVDEAVTFLIEHLPPQLHLVITTREDPRLPLARLRARGQLGELRAADLRFTPAEAAAFLNEGMGLRLTEDHIAALEERTEGWITGLQLAALSIQGHADSAAFIRAFTGDHRYVVDYLVDEVLARQPAPVRSFLLQTAILERLTGSLCAAVTGQADSAAQLEALQRGNFFVVPLDDTRQWYRYHHLFAEVLATQLHAEQPALVPELHRRASVWYEQQGATADAIRHALAAADVARAADLIELALPAIQKERQETTLLAWLRALPDDLVRCRPVLSAVYGGSLLARGELAGVAARLRDAERWLEPEADGRTGPDVGAMVVVDHTAFRRLPGSIAVWWAGLALASGDVAGTETYARRALALVPADDLLERGSAAGLLGLAAWTSGDLETAYQTFTDGMTWLRAAGHVPDAVSGAIPRADIRVAQGQLRAAMQIYTEAEQLAAAQEPPVLLGAADLQVGMAELEYEWNDLASAMRRLQSSQELGQRTGFPPNPARWHVALARIRAAEGDRAAALNLLDEAERRTVRDFFPIVRPIAALKARLWLMAGQIADTRSWVRQQGLSAQDEPSYLREHEHLTLARVLLAHEPGDAGDDAPRAAMDLLQRLLVAAEAGGRTGSVIAILIAQALAHHAHGASAAALAALDRALRLGEPEGYVRSFVDEGPAMAALLELAATRGPASPYVRRLCAALDHPTTQVPGNAGLLEPLSARERDVLRLLCTELSGPEIARELMVSLHTLRTHTNHIYGKLGVNTRRAAVRRAAELGLI